MCRDDGTIQNADTFEEEAGGQTSHSQNRTFEETVVELAIEILRDFTLENPKSTGALVKEISKKLDEESAPKDYKIYYALLASSKDETSKIQSRKGKGGGYYLAEPLHEISDTDELKENISVPTKENESEKTLEKHIWPLVRDWLITSKGIARSSEKVANLKTGGVWSNPDVVGLSPIEDLGFFDVEIATVEVKPSLHNWRYFFFEAVSHKRFSERVYFAYRTNTSKPKDEDELVAYAEKYGIGLVRIELSDDDFEKLPQWGMLENSEKANLLDLCVEVVPAPLETVSLQEKISFLRRIKISSKVDIYEFGS